MALVNDTIRLENGQEVYVANLNGATKFILPLSGKGLWGGIGGYLTLDEDKNTIYGVNFNHESETPGLGAKIVEEIFPPAVKALASLGSRLPTVARNDGISNNRSVFLCRLNQLTINRYPQI